jgi:hypothetical protein
LLNPVFMKQEELIGQVIGAAMTALKKLKPGRKRG